MAADVADEAVLDVVTGRESSSFILGLIWQNGQLLFWIWEFFAGFLLMRVGKDESFFFLSNEGYLDVRVLNLKGKQGETDLPF